MTHRRSVSTVVFAVSLIIAFIHSLPVFAQIHTPSKPERSFAAVSQTTVSPAVSPIPLFLPATVFDTGGTGAGVIVVADLDGDGKLDLVASNNCGAVCPEGALSVQLGNGDGTFQTAVLYDSGGQYPDSVAIADINGDGHLDIVVANLCVPAETNCGTGLAADGTVGVMLGRGDGTFKPVVLYDAGGESTFSLAVGDVNRDGRPDVIVTNWDRRNNGDNRVGMLLGNGDGTFQPAVTYSSGGRGYETWPVVVADVNGDGNPDLLVGSPNGDTGFGHGSVDVMLGNGDGTFRTPVNYDAGGGLTNSIATADVNGDGLPDLVVANYCANFCQGEGSVGVLLANGDGTFRPVVTYDAGSPGSRTVAVADVNGDGKPDLLVSNECEHSECKKGVVGFLKGNGDGTFQKVVSFDLITYDEGLAIADVNGDGRPDLLVTNSLGFNNPTSVRVLLNNPALVYSTKTALASSLNPSQFGQSVTFTAQVSSKKGPISDGELVTFFDGKSELASIALVNSRASYTTSALSAKAHNIKAVYSGDQWFKSSAGYVKQGVNK